MSLRSVSQTSAAARPERQRGLSAPWALAAALSLALALVSGNGRARGRGRTVAELDPAWASAPSAQYAALSKPACLAELRRRHIAFQPVAEARGVVAPVRVVDGVGGVLYRTALSRSRRLENPHDVFDCRLVLALHDFSRILRKHDIDEVLMFSGWRPPSKRWPKGKPAVRHPGALAIDIYRFGTWVSAEPEPAAQPADGTAPPARSAKHRRRKRAWLDVKEHFGGRIGARTCGPKAAAPHPISDQARQLRAIVCEAAEARIFTSILTPNYDRPHANHVHLDLATKVKWRIVR